MTRIIACAVALVLVAGCMLLSTGNEPARTRMARLDEVRLWFGNGTQCAGWLSPKGNEKAYCIYLRPDADPLWIRKDVVVRFELLHKGKDHRDQNRPSDRLR